MPKSEMEVLGPISLRYGSGSIENEIKKWIGMMEEGPWDLSITGIEPLVTERFIDPEQNGRCVDSVTEVILFVFYKRKAKDDAHR